MRKTTELEIHRGPRDLKIAVKGERPSSGAVAMIPIRDGREAYAWSTAAYFQAAPSMHQLLCDLNDHIHMNARHHSDCLVDQTGICTCGLDDLLIRLTKQIDKLERADELYSQVR